MARIASLGSSLQDIYLIDRDDFTPASFEDKTIFGDLNFGTKVDIDRVKYSVGGGGTNSATTFARHGHQAILFSNIGHDPAGDAILSALDEENIDNSYVSYVRKSTGCSIILLDAKTGERTILTHRGASAKFDNLSEADLELARPDWLYVTSLRGDFDTLRRFLKKASSLDIKVMLNPGKLELLEKHRLLRVLGYVDVLLLNKKEAKMLIPGETLPELLSHLKNYVPSTIITSGSMGAIATDGSETYRLGLYEDLKIKDTTGAGDAFGSGFLAHYAAGHSFKSSLVFASANSTAVVASLGAHTGLLSGSESLHPMPLQRV